MIHHWTVKRRSKMSRIVGHKPLVTDFVSCFIHFLYGKNMKSMASALHVSMQQFAADSLPMRTQWNMHVPLCQQWRNWTNKARQRNAAISRGLLWQVITEVLLYTSMSLLRHYAILQTNHLKASARKQWISGPSTQSFAISLPFWYRELS